MVKFVLLHYLSSGFKNQSPSQPQPSGGTNLSFGSLNYVEQKTLVYYPKYSNYYRKENGLKNFTNPKTVCLIFPFKKTFKIDIVLTSPLASENFGRIIALVVQ